MKPALIRNTRDGETFISHYNVSGRWWRIIKGGEHIAENTLWEWDGLKWVTVTLGHSYGYVSDNIDAIWSQLTK